MVLFDALLGVGVFAVVSAIMGEPFQWLGLLVAVVATLLPDLVDFPLFFLLRDKLPKLYCHRQIAHYPGLYAIALAGLWYGGIPTYYLALLGGGIAVHFADDLFAWNPHLADEWGLALFPGMRRLIILNGRFIWFYPDDVPNYFKVQKMDSSKRCFGYTILTPRLFMLSNVQAAWGAVSVGALCFYLLLRMLQT